MILEVTKRTKNKYPMYTETHHIYMHVRWNCKALKSVQEAEHVKKYIAVVPNKLYSEEEGLTITIALFSEKDSVY